VRRLRAWLLRLVDPLRRGRRDEEMDAELASHLQLHIDEYVRDGLSPAEARRQALLKLGGLDLTREQYRDRRGLPLVDTLRQDVRQALRMARRQPGFTAAAMLTLAIGIGSVAVMYSVVRQVLLDPFPYVHSDRMVDVIIRDTPSGRIAHGALAAAEYLDYQEQSTVFEDVLGTNVEELHYVGDEGADRLAVAWVTPNMFSFLGVRPLLGREFNADDARSGATPVAVMNHRTWLNRFGGDPAVIGRALMLNGQARTVVGIMPPRFEWNVGDLWAPLDLDRAAPASVRNARWFQARLKPGVSVAAAQAQMDVVTRRRAALHPDEYPTQFHVQVITVIDWVVGRFRGVLYTLFAAVGLLLVIACCNVANMLLARATTREREISLRAALGASRTRLVRQLLVEGLVLAAGGAIGGCLLALGGIRALSVWMPRQNIPWETQLRLDLPVLAFALLTALAATLMFGIVPALQGARRELATGASGAGRSGTATRGQTRLRGLLIVAEVGLSVVLLLGAGIVLRSFVSLVGADLKFDPERVLFAQLGFAPGTKLEPAERTRFYRAALDRIEALPQVQAVALATGTAPLGGVFSSDLTVAGGPSPIRQTLARFSSEGYRAALGIPLVAGRDLTAVEVDTGRKVALVNQTFATRVFGAENPLGRTIGLTRLTKMPEPVADPTFEIVGVIADVANQAVQEPAAPEVVLPYGLRGRGGASLLVRTPGDPLQSIALVRQQVRSADPTVAVTNPDSLDRLMQQFVFAQPRFVVIVLAMFASTGLALVGLGIYGVLAYSVSQQTREMAIRMAMGGERRDVLRHVMNMGLRLVIVGLAVGLALSLGTNRLLRSQLWNTSQYDALTHVLVVSTIIGVGVLACFTPARRAMRVEPIVALRHE
jgi:putative ABC transport system permease protein